MTLFDLSGKTAVITGATKGIGRAIASRMAEHGANIVVSSRKQDMCDMVAQDINENWAKGGNEAAAIPCHISHKEQLRALVDQTLARFGGPERFAEAVDKSLDRLAEVIGDPKAFRALLFGQDGNRP